MAINIGLYEIKIKLQTHDEKETKTVTFYAMGTDWSDASQRIRCHYKFGTPESKWYYSEVVLHNLVQSGIISKEFVQE